MRRPSGPCAGPSEGRTALRTRKAVSALSAVRRLDCAWSSWSCRMAVNSVRRWRLRSAAAATNLSATALTIAAVLTGSAPRRAIRTKLASCAARMRSSSPSFCPASVIVLSLNSTLPPGRTAETGGIQASPMMAPIEPPTAPSWRTPSSGSARKRNRAARSHSTR